MSQENVEIVRRVYEAWSVGDFRSTVDVYDRRVVFIDGVTSSLDAGYFVGADGVRDYMRAFLEQWSTYTIHEKELIDAGDHVVASVVQRMVGHASGMPIEFNIFQVWSFRGRSVIRLEVFREREEAFAAMGLSE